MFRGSVLLLTITGLALGQAMVQHAAAAAGGAAAAAGSKKVADGLDKLLGAAAGSTNAAAVPAAPPPAPTTGRRGKPSPYEPQVNRAGGTELAPVVTPPGMQRVPIPSPVDVEEGAAPAPAVAISGEAVPGNSWTPRRPQSHGTVPSFTPYIANEGPVVSRGSRRNTSTPPPPQVAGTIQMTPPSIAVPVIPPPPPPVLATPEKLAAIHEGASIDSVVASLGTPASKISMYEDGKLSETLRIESKGTRLGTIHLVNGVVTAIEPAAN